jgi:hypothetical protein
MGMGPAFCLPIRTSPVPYLSLRFVAVLYMEAIATYGGRSLLLIFRRNFSMSSGGRLVRPRSVAPASAG